MKKTQKTDALSFSYNIGSISSRSLNNSINEYLSCRRKTIKRDWYGFTSKNLLVPERNILTNHYGSYSSLNLIEGYQTRRGSRISLKG